MDHGKTLEDWLRNLSTKVELNSEVVTPESLQQKHLFHISKDTNVKEFIPRIGDRQGKTEDRTVPRITVAPTLLGCMIGYAGQTHDFFDLPSTGEPQDLKYKGGYKIYAFEFNAAVKPNARLVYDANMSGEHWLVSFSPENSTYKAVSAGKMFYSNMVLTARAGKLPIISGDLYVEITLEEGCRFSKNIFLPKGYYLITGDAAQNIRSWETDSTMKMRAIDKNEYMSAKLRSAALLEYKEELPKYMDW